MGQQLFKINFERIDSIEINDTTDSVHSDGIRSCNEDDKISYLFPWKMNYLLKTSIETKTNNQLSNAQHISIQQIRTHLFQLTDLKDFKDIDTEINQILIENVLSFIEKNYEKAMKEMTDSWEKQQQLQKSLINKFQKDEENDKTSIFLLIVSEHMHINEKINVEI